MSEKIFNSLYYLFWILWSSVFYSCGKDTSTQLFFFVFTMWSTAMFTLTLSKK